MLTILLIIIYIAFISLGLPDAILGSAWPLMHTDLNVPISYAGIATMIVSGGTIISSFSAKNDSKIWNRKSHHHQCTLNSHWLTRDLFCAKLYLDLSSWNSTRNRSWSSGCCLK